MMLRYYVVICFTFSLRDREIKACPKLHPTTIGDPDASRCVTINKRSVSASDPIDTSRFGPVDVLLPSTSTGVVRWRYRVRCRLVGGWRDEYQDFQRVRDCSGGGAFTFRMGISGLWRAKPEG